MNERPAQLAGPFEPFVSLYAEQGLVVPRLGGIRPEDVPQPYQRLLVHTNAMTPTLEDFFGQPLELRVLASQVDADTVRRQVVLVGARDTYPLELGVIRIDLSCFDAQPRELLRHGRTPLGRLLGDFGIAFVCRPALFFRVEPDAAMRQALGLGPGAPALFGRCNRMHTPDGRVMADVVEVLAPLREAHHGPTLRAV